MSEPVQQTKMVIHATSQEDSSHSVRTIGGHAAIPPVTTEGYRRMTAGLHWQDDPGPLAKTTLPSQPLTLMQRRYALVGEAGSAVVGACSGARAAAGIAWHTGLANTIRVVAQVTWTPLLSAVKCPVGARGAGGAV